MAQGEAAGCTPAAPVRRTSGGTSGGVRFVRFFFFRFHAKRFLVKVLRCISPPAIGNHHLFACSCDQRKSIVRSDFRGRCGPGCAVSVAKADKTDTECGRKRQSDKGRGAGASPRHSLLVIPDSSVITWHTGVPSQSTRTLILLCCPHYSSCGLFCQVVVWYFRRHEGTQARRGGGAARGNGPGSAPRKLARPRKRGTQGRTRSGQPQGRFEARCVGCGVFRSVSVPPDAGGALAWLTAWQHADGTDGGISPPTMPGGARRALTAAWVRAFRAGASAGERRVCTYGSSRQERWQCQRSAVPGAIRPPRPRSPACPTA